MFTDGVHFPCDNVSTLTTSNSNPSAVQLHYIQVKHILLDFNFSLPTLLCVTFSPYTCIYRNVVIKLAVSSTVGITGKIAVALLDKGVFKPSCYIPTSCCAQRK